MPRPLILRAVIQPRWCWLCWLVWFGSAHVAARPLDGHWVGGIKDCPQRRVDAAHSHQLRCRGGVHQHVLQQHARQLVLQPGHRPQVEPCGRHAYCFRALCEISHLPSNVPCRCYCIWCRCMRLEQARAQQAVHAAARALCTWGLEQRQKCIVRGRKHRDVCIRRRHNTAAVRLQVAQLLVIACSSGSVVLWFLSTDISITTSSQPRAVLSPVRAMSELCWGNPDLGRWTRRQRM